MRLRWPAVRYLKKGAVRRSAPSCSGTCPQQDDQHDDGSHGADYGVRDSAGVVRWVPARVSSAAHQFSLASFSASFHARRFSSAPAPSIMEPNLRSSLVLAAPLVGRSQSTYWLTALNAAHAERSMPISDCCSW